MDETVVIVGAGTTGVSAAQTLRQEGYTGRIVLIGAESVPPYERPPLSKEFLHDDNRDVATIVLKDQQWYDEHGIEVRLGRTVTAIDPARHCVQLDDGSRLTYRQLLIATGGRPRRIPGVEGQRVHYLRDAHDAERLGAALTPRSHLIVLGGGFIGCEVAATARRRGARVTVIEREPAPLARVLGADIGSAIARVHRDKGVDFRVGSDTSELSVTTQGVSVTLSSGESIDGTELLVAIGMVPNDELASAAGITVDNGIVVDDACQTSAPDVYAAGDVAVHAHPLFDRLPLRVEQYDNAVRQGAAAARAMLGDHSAYDDPHWFWSDQYEHSLQCIGIPTGHDQVVLRGSTDDNAFTAFYLRRGAIRAAVSLNRGKDVLMARTLISVGTPVDLHALADESVPVNRVAPRTRTPSPASEAPSPPPGMAVGAGRPMIRCRVRAGG